MNFLAVTLTLPLWLAIVLGLLALWSALDRLLIPSVRWFLRRRVNRVLEEINTRLKIRIPPFKLTKREVLIDRLLYDPQVQEAAEAEAREARAPREVVQERIHRYAREIVPAFNAYVYFRFGYWLARSIARSLYRVRLGYSDERGLSSIGPDSTVVFLINHRSNMDYILVSYLAAEKAALSYAVGEWARIWPLQTLIRAMGAYFVRRNSGDPLYRKVLERYVAMATQAGVTQAVFPEGGLSRDGRLRRPKLGILDYMVRSFDPEGRARHRLRAGRHQLRPRLRGPQLSSRARLRPRRGQGRPRPCGRPCRFVFRNLWLLAAEQAGTASATPASTSARPCRLKEHIRRHGVDFRSLGREERSAAIEELGRDLMAAVARVVPAVPVSLVATAFLRQPSRAWSELELKGAALDLMRELEARGAHVYVPRGDQDYAITVGLRMLTLRHLVTESGGLYSAEPAELPLLAYYANSITHLLPEPQLPAP